MSHLPQKVADARDRIIEKLSQENKELKFQLATLMENARHNESVMAHFEEIETIILTCQTLPELLRLLTEDIRQRFRLQYVQIRLTDGIGKPFLGVSGLLGPEAQGFEFLKEEEMARYFSVGVEPILASDPPGQWKEYFFGKNYPQLRSMAIVPLRDHEQTLGCLCMGSRSPKRYRSGDQTLFLQRLGTKMAIGLKNAIAHQRVEQMAARDMLTGLYNRHYLEDRIAAEFQRVERYGHELSCAVIDMDGLKMVNDRFGHPEGDRLLRCVADTLSHSVRKADAVIRTGGDEFVILFPSTSLKNAIHAAENIINRLAAVELRLGGQLHRISVSIGLAHCPHPEIRSGEELIRVADHWMYVAKHKGGGRVEW